ncbi:methylated-DNA--[protein]-cysteine S-methyltransferase [Corynebacterium sp. TAE3-ERU12]|uniref:methylated-DNA--[protein]-cysteine S-methyltransferase n=1 Tax=Corynebacterium sp. TAE3-ERU12 TaxID=2849491 RepID=UPI001C44CB95|nr:methylated-DNA--[protein]-cysteine S-methyltransferase [Corynebacterium sp. TAE3-ERU12]MBV7294384.1 methylated-DNA--[protein]-cysteine S-methyltransferase [Corynebacterium sp. TAE3-ERU12]
MNEPSDDTRTRTCTRVLPLHSSPGGHLLISATAAGLTSIDFHRPTAGAHNVGKQPADTHPATEHLDAAVTQIQEYLAGQRRDFDLVLDVPALRGESFRARALRAMRAIPFGETRTYAELAALAGSARAHRAAGTSCATNPVPLVVPCHRIVPASGGLGRYGPGADYKKWLLEHEISIRMDS